MKEIKMINKLGIKIPKVIASFAMLFLALDKIVRELGIYAKVSSIDAAIKKYSIYGMISTKGKIIFNKLEAIVSYLAMFVSFIYLMLFVFSVIFFIDPVDITLEKLGAITAVAAAMALYSVLLMVNGGMALDRNKVLIGCNNDWIN